MYQFTFALCTFVLCISCINSAPSSPTLLSALLSPPSASAPASTYEANAAVAPSQASSPPHNDRHETGSTMYDQKQSGKYNIHLNIKDVAIIALDAGGDGGIGDAGQDYYEDYDLSDFTVKPVFGLVEISSNKPSTNNSDTLPLINFELDNWMANATSANKTEASASNSTAIEEPIIKDPKPQSVEILNENSASTTATSAVSSTAAPAIELSSPTAISHKQTPLPIQFPIQPDQIPVQVILDALPAVQKAHSGRQRVNGGGAINANWRLRNGVRATPSHNRRITPPHSGFEDSPYFAAAASSALGNNKYRKHHSFSHNAQRRNCIVDQNGQCQNSQRQSFSSPTL